MCVAVAQAQLYVQFGRGDPFQEACSAIKAAEVPLEVVRMAALEGLPLGPALLRGLMSLDVQQGYTTSELSAVLHGFVEAGGQPSGEQLALASLGALGFTHELGQLGATVSAFHNGTTLRAAWHDLASLWQLASRPDVRGGLWPELSASGVSANQVMEPLQDVMLFGALGQLQFMANAPTAWGLDELKEELRSVLQTSSLPASKVDALLHGDLDSVLNRISTLFTFAYAQWQIEGRWSVERRTYVPLLTRGIYSLAEDVGVAGARLGSNGRWEYDGTIAPRLHRDLTDPNGEDHAWAQRVIKEADGPMMKLLERALEDLGSGERAAFQLDVHETHRAETAKELFGLDLRQLALWNETQKDDLRAGLSYIKGSMQQAELMSANVVQSKRQVVSAARSKGFGGATKKKPGKRAKRKRL